MSKNYFTDIQVKEAINKITPFKGHLGKRLLTEFELKNLMNLAVEAAIGEPKAWSLVDKNEELYFTAEGFIWKNKSDAEIRKRSHLGCQKILPLYSVKELDN